MATDGTPIKHNHARPATAGQVMCQNYYHARFMLLALCRCKASEHVDIVAWFKGLATQQMCKDNYKHTQI